MRGTLRVSCAKMLVSLIYLMKLYNLALGPVHPASSATISAHRSPIASTVSIGFTVVISGNTPASAMRTPLSPRSRKLQSTTAMSSRARSPILVVPAGW